MNKEINSDKSTSEKKIGWKGLFGKIVCILLSLILWVYVAYEKNPQTSKNFTNIPLVLTGRDALENRNLTYLPTNIMVSVKLSGERNVLAKVSKNDIKAYASVADITTTGVQEPIITITGIPETLSVEQKKITSGTLVTENLIKKTLDLKIDRGGVMGESIIEKEKYTTPGQITVKGPESLLKDVEAWTEAINVSNINRSEVVKKAKVVLKNSKGEVLTDEALVKSDMTVDVTIKFEKKKKVNVIKPMIVGSLPGYNITVEKLEPEKVTVTGPVEDIDLLKDVETIQIDANDLAGSKSLECVLVLPQNIICEDTVTAILKFEEIVTEEE